MVCINGLEHEQNQGKRTPNAWCSTVDDSTENTSAATLYVFDLASAYDIAIPLGRHRRALLVETRERISVFYRHFVHDPLCLIAAVSKNNIHDTS